MKEISINCAGLENESELIAHIAKTLGFSDCCTDQPDNLYDCLTAINQTTQIAFFGLAELPFADRVRATLQDAETDNFWLNISIA